MYGGTITFGKRFTIITLSDLFMWLFMLLTYVVIAVNSAAILFQIRFGILLIAGILGFCQMQSDEIKNIRILFFVILCAFSWAVSFMMRGDGAYKPDLFLYSLLYMGLAVNMTSHRHNDIWAGILFYIVCGISLFRLVVMGEPIRGFLKEGSSYNFISALILLYLSYYCIALNQNGKPIPYLAAFVFAWLCIVAYGRGGIVTGLFFLAIVTVLGVRDETNKSRRQMLALVTVLTIIIGGIVGFLYIRQNNYELINKLFAKFYVRSNEKEPRLEIWSMYLTECSKRVMTILFGANPDKVGYEGNLHNAFFQMYAHFGLLPFLLLVYSYIRLSVYTYRKKNMYLFCLLLTIAVRAMTDKIAFQGYCEPLFYYAVFSWFNITEKQKMLSYEHIQPHRQIQIGAQ